MSDEKEISVVIPCYNSSKSLPELTSRLLNVLNNLSNDCEIIFVNDNSKDNTIKVLQELQILNDNIIVIDLMYNVGQFKALMCGLENASGRFIVTMDDDLQHPPEEIKKLYNYLKVNKDIDCVFGEYSKKEHSFVRNIGSFFIRKLNELTVNKPKNIKFSSFRCFTRQLANTITSHSTMFPIMGPLIVKSTSRIKNVEVSHEKRKFGNSNYNFFKLIRTTFDHVVNFSSLPLKIISLFGVSISLLSVGITIIFAIRYMFGYILVPGWTSIFLAINFYSGLILLSTGIIGEYLIRILQEVKGDPRYKIRTIYSNQKSKINV